MNKEELLKIYSAYLPYKLKIGFEGDDYEHLLVGVDLCNEGLQLISPFGDFGRCEIDKPKPVLYDLSYLTKEIEHEGEKFVPIEYFDVGDDSSNSYPYDFGSGNVSIIRTLKSIAENNIVFDVKFLPFEVVQRLISWKINVFGLKEDQFINKATLNK